MTPDPDGRPWARHLQANLTRIRFVLRGGAKRLIVLLKGFLRAPPLRMVAALLIAAVAYFGLMVGYGRVADDEAAHFGPLARANVGALLVAVVCVVVLVLTARFLLRLSWRWPLGLCAGGLVVLVGLGGWDIAHARHETPKDSGWQQAVRGRVDIVVVLRGPNRLGNGRMLGWLEALLARDGPPSLLTTTWDLAYGVAVETGSGPVVIQPLTTSLDQAKAALVSQALPRATGAVPSDTSDLLLNERGAGWRNGSARVVASIFLPGAAASSSGGCSIAPSSDRVLLLLPDGDSDACGSDELALLTAGSGRDVFDVAGEVMTNQPPSWQQQFAFQYRPHLLFDSKEFYRPLDVDMLLGERLDGRPAHFICAERRARRDDCAALETAADLTRSSDYIDINGALRYGTDSRTGFDLIRLSRSGATPPGNSSALPEGIPPLPDVPLTDASWSFCKPTPDDRECDGGPWSRIYYHVTEDGDVLHIDYWWYFRFNVSPVKTAAMCLPGFSITEKSCYDHESDWEGVTVTVRNASVAPGAPYPPPLTVTYAGHSWRYAFEWNALVGVWSELLEAGRIDERVTTHPLVFVAFGSHASYPRPCDADDEAPLKIDKACWQDDHREKLVKALSFQVPDGRRDGADSWLMNSDELCAQVGCVASLPVFRDGAAARWNAYPGRWGRAECALGVGFSCVRSVGPESPSFQERYQCPGKALLGNLSNGVHRVPAESQPDCDPGGAPPELRHA